MNLVSTDSLKAIERASGYHTLGMNEDALIELDALSEPDSGHPDIILMRAQILNSLEQFAQAVELLRAHEANCSDRSAWFILAAYATRRARDIREARAILQQGIHRFPDEWLMIYNLACYEAQLDNSGEALTLLHKAVKLHPKCRAMAAQDPDFTPFKNDPLFITLIKGGTN